MCKGYPGSDYCEEVAAPDVMRGAWGFETHKKRM